LNQQAATNAAGTGSGSLAELLEKNHLLRKVLYTLGFIAIYRIGVQVPIPGVNTDALADFFRDQGGNFFGMFNMFSGGALERFSIFALGVMPYISASIISQLLTVAVPYLEQLSKEGESGRRKITQYTRYGTVVLALIQGFMISNALASEALGGGQLVSDPSMAWKILTTLSLTAGTCFVMWLGEQITDRGVGNGISLIIFVGIVAGLPQVIGSTYSQYNSQEISLFPILAIIAVCILVCAGVVFMEQGARQIPVQYAKRQVGRRQFGGQTSHLPMKLNSAGVIPPIFAGSLLQFPITIAAMYPESKIGQLVDTVFNPGGWMYNVVYVVLIIFFAFFYTAITFKSDDIAENLKKNGGFVPGIRPGKNTADYLDKIINRLTLSGSIYLAFICVLPTILMARFNVQFYFGGTSLLIVVGVALDTFRQIEAHRQSLRYDAFLKQSSGKASRIRRRM
jgi:preprotein translocase subunit SecY